MSFDLVAQHKSLIELEAHVNELLTGLELTVAADFLPHSILLSVHEACANIIDHAYQDKSGIIHVEMSATADPNRIVILLKDSGASFDMDAVPERDLEVVAERGLGLFLMREMMDEVTYKSDATGNQWRLIKNY